MNLDIFNIPDPSGRMSRESYLSKNYKEIYDSIIEYCQINSIQEIPFKEKIYLFLNRINKPPKCKNPNCDRTVKFKNSNIGYLKYCSNACISSDPDIKKIKEEKSIDKFGTKSPSQSNLIKDKIITTNNNKWGGNSPMSSKKIREKSKKTLFENWGVDNPSKSQEILNKRVNSFKNNIEKYKESYKRTSINKYGVNHPWMDSKVHEKSVIGSIKSKNNKIKNKIEERLSDYENYKLISIDYTPIKRDILISCSICGLNFNLNREDFYLRYREKSTICTNCNPINSSKSGKEMELYKFISKNYNGEILLNKSIIKPQEIDIYLPDLKLGFEFNGLWWHSESQKGKNYHYNKTKRCIDLNIDLVHIWEDDWTYKNDIIKSIILNKINKTTNRIFARNCEIREVDIKESKDFLNNNHIIGNCRSNYKIGLYYQNSLISIMTFTKNKEGYELSRFCNKINTLVIGGSSKLFTYFVKKYNPNFIYSYSDNSMFNGNLYEKLGFIFKSEVKINYKWVISKKRCHKSNYRKTRLVKMGFSINKSESEIMIEDVGSYKIWDCGLKKWIWEPIIKY
jgi:hypothetical protein